MPRREVPESVLARRLAEGSREAWDAFLERYGPLLVEAARRLARGGGGATTAGDLSQEIWKRFLERRDLFRRFVDGGAGLRTWVWRVALHFGMHALRDARRHDPRRAAREAAGAGSPAVPDGTDAREDARALARGMAALAPDRALAVRLYYVEGRPYREVAAALGTSPSQAWRLIAEALASLRDVVEGGSRDLPDSPERRPGPREE